MANVEVHEARSHPACCEAPLSYAIARRRGTNEDANKLYPEDRAIHDWYRFILSFPSHLVRRYMVRFGLDPNSTVLDPFCGTGTVLVECKKAGIPSIGIEANPLAHFASSVKVNWTPDPDELLAHAEYIASLAESELTRQGIPDTPALQMPQLGVTHLESLPSEQRALLLAGSISPLPLHKVLVLLRLLKDHRDDRFHNHELLALAKALPTMIGNLHFGPEVGVGPAKTDAAVIGAWLTCVRTIVNDLGIVNRVAQASAVVLCADSRSIGELLQAASIDAVITSPPYPNEKDYTRTTRLESVLLGFLRDQAGLRSLKKMLLRSNTRGIYSDDRDDLWVSDHSEIQRLATEIEARRIELGKTSGFERLYARVTKLYFGGMKRHLADLRKVLKPGAMLAYVVGDQASYLRVKIQTGRIMADLARSLGYEVIGIDLFRTRLATATREQLREEVVVLRWPGVAGTGAHDPAKPLGPHPSGPGWSAPEEGHQLRWQI